MTAVATKVSRGRPLANPIALVAVNGRNCSRTAGWSNWQQRRWPKYPRESLAVFVVPITSGIAEDVVVLLSST